MPSNTVAIPANAEVAIRTAAARRRSVATVIAGGSFSREIWMPGMQASRITASAGTKPDGDNQRKLDLFTAAMAAQVEGNERKHP